MEFDSETSEEIWQSIMEATVQPWSDPDGLPVENVAGVTFDNRQTVIPTLKPGDELRLVREPDNRFDPGAVRIETMDGRQVGYVQRHGNIRREIDSTGTVPTATVRRVVGGGNGGPYGVQVKFKFEPKAAEAPAPAPEPPPSPEEASEASAKLDEIEHIVGEAKAEMDELAKEEGFSSAFVRAGEDDLLVRMVRGFFGWAEKEISAAKSGPSKDKANGVADKILRNTDRFVHGVLAEKWRKYRTSDIPVRDGIIAGANILSSVMKRLERLGQPASPAREFTPIQPTATANAENGERKYYGKSR